MLHSVLGALAADFEQMTTISTHRLVPEQELIKRTITVEAQLLARLMLAEMAGSIRAQ